jgi:hypothetical protein
MVQMYQRERAGDPSVEVPPLARWVLTPNEVYAVPDAAQIPEQFAAAETYLQVSTHFCHATLWLARTLSSCNTSVRQFDRLCKHTLSRSLLQPLELL